MFQLGYNVLNAGGGSLKLVYVCHQKKPQFGFLGGLSRGSEPLLTKGLLRDGISLT